MGEWPSIWMEIDPSPAFPLKRSLSSEFFSSSPFKKLRREGTIERLSEDRSGDHNDRTGSLKRKLDDSSDLIIREVHTSPFVLPEYG